ncbi:uncharacterized protein [Aegilops tauschii subsp. strangulata]|uniref:uncharacterized protein n=1 Tax=Aegilops tauschii subsp. strangulata TaxID=200361 RepID=UPI00098B589E
MPMEAAHGSPPIVDLSRPPSPSVPRSSVSRSPLVPLPPTLPVSLPDIDRRRLPPLSLPDPDQPPLLPSFCRFPISLPVAGGGALLPSRCTQTSLPLPAFLPPPPPLGFLSPIPNPLALHSFLAAATSGARSWRPQAGTEDPCPARSGARPSPSDEVVQIVHGDAAGDPTVVTVSCPDKTGLGCDLCRLVVLFGLNVHKGDMSTDGHWCYIRLGSPPRAGAGPWTGTSSRSGWWSFVRTALEQTRLHTALMPHPSQEKFRLIRANDDATVLDALSFSARKIRVLRSLTVEKKNYVQEPSLVDMHEEEEIVSPHKEDA